MDRFYSLLTSLKCIWIILIASLLGIGNAAAQSGLIVNEASNGTGGDMEFIELLVVADTNTCFVDIRGWVFDDNSGDFSCGPAEDCGVAAGHGRFSITDTTWANVPKGSIIVLYNPASISLAMPAPDPTDSDSDLVYIVPVSHPSIEITAGNITCNAGVQSPRACGPCPGTVDADSGYGGNTYTSGGAWRALGIRNDGDAIQTRTPAGAYFHGISFGNTSINGGPDSLKIVSSDGSGRAYFFTDGDPRNVTNWSHDSASTSETPGVANNLANAVFINNIQTDTLQCVVLPVKFEAQLAVEPWDFGNYLTWTTTEELNLEHFEIERSYDVQHGFDLIGFVKGQQTDYSYIDQSSTNRSAWYRLKVVDVDGNFEYSRVAAVYKNQSADELVVNIYPNPAETQVNFVISNPSETILTLYDLQGRLLHQQTVNQEVSLDISQFPSGFYLWRVSSSIEVVAGKLQVY